MMPLPTVFATAVVIQRQCGGDLAEILDKISHIIRERFRILGQVQALGCLHQLTFSSFCSERRYFGTGVPGCVPAQLV